MHASKQGLRPGRERVQRLPIVAVRCTVRLHLTDSLPRRQLLTRIRRLAEYAGGRDSYLKTHEW